ncbi:MAG TPA: ABC transporter substrate-binding protein [Chloroflexota bacterium]
MRIRFEGVVLMVALTLVGACAPAQLAAPREVRTGGPVVPKHLTAAILSDPKALGSEAGSAPGVDALRGLLHAGLANPDERDSVRAQLAEAVPSLENGLWTLQTDGRMETTWKIRPNAQWHDGTPFTSEDVLFTAQVGQDRELPAFRDPGYQAMASIEAIDGHTVLVRWKDLYINADQMFGNPLPRHLLGGAAQEDKPNFTRLAYWSQEFVGTGPFKLREWVPGSQVLLTANDAYVLGRPPIDELEIKLILQSTVLITNLLAGVVELPLGRTLSFDQALEMRDRWQEGRVEIVPRPGWTVIYPQLTYTHPPIVGDVRFRRGLIHAINRQEMVDTLVAGFSEVAHSTLPLNHPEYAEIKARVPRYEYDPAKATQMMQDLGYRKGPDGGLVDSTGQRLAVEIRTTGDNDNNVKALYSVVDYWQQIGVGVDPVLVAAQQQSDREYTSTFPGFNINRHPNDASWLVNFTSARRPTRENNFTGSGAAGYHSPEYDGLYERYSRAIRMPERIGLIGELIYNLADQAAAMGLYYDNLSAFIGNRVLNVVVPQQYGAQYVWSAYQWDVRS